MIGLGVTFLVMAAFIVGTVYGEVSTDKGEN